MLHSFAAEMPDGTERRELTVAEHHADPHDDTDVFRHMPPSLQAELKTHDSAAWYQVVGLLLLIISIGLVLAIGTALFSGVSSVNL